MVRTAEQTTRDQRFIARLQGYVDGRDRGALAILRRGLTKRPGQAPEMYRFVEPWLQGEQSGWTQDSYYLIAALFASHPTSLDDDARRPTNLGASFARMAPTDEQRQSIEHRFTVLLNSSQEDLHVHLRQAISLLKAKGTPVDWALLLRDIRWWDHEDRWVQRSWARAFWGSFSPGTTDEIRDEEEPSS